MNDGPLPSEPRASVSHVGRRTFSEKTEEGRVYLQSRIALFSKVMFLMMLGYYAFVLVVTSMIEEARVAQRPLATVLGAIALTGLGAMWWIASHKLRSPHVVTAMDVSSVVDPGILLGVSIHLMSELRFAPFAAFIGMCFLVFGRALIVPSSAARTALASSLAMLPLVLSVSVMAIRQPESLVAPAPLQMSLYVAWAVLAVILASLGSSIIYGLREQVRRAQTLGQYTLLEKIGEGGMGSVYRARHTMLRRPTAIKLLPPDKAGEQQLLRFEREVQNTAELTHPNTVAIFDYGRSPEGVFYYAMELLDGFDLETLVEKFGPQAPGRVVHILEQVCGALAEAHERGLVHRDIKPANIFLCERGGVPDVVKVLDFGLVKDLGSTDSDVTDLNVVAGTPAFLAPEVITAPTSIGPASDLYAVGAVAYFLLAGKHVFTGATVVEVCGHHVHTAPTPPSQALGAPLPEPIEKLVLKCLSKKPGDRPSDARELRQALRALVDASWTEADALAWWQRERTHLAQKKKREPITGLSMTIDLNARKTL
ncbi:MAG TPA: protein kinase [Polyangiaceae bacterium]|nr:protein kinase [Polyangiaceae bacterium]